jgi:bifunctional non-homologous end joining protein LigD
MTDGVTITHPDKVMFPDDGITKGDLAAYYQDVAPVMLPHIVGRPVTMERFHRGIGDKGFFQKNVAKPPPMIETVAVPKKDGVVNYPVVSDASGLLWMANQNSITPHVWTARVPDLMHPDICLFDLDPLDDDLGRLGRAALLVRDLLAELGCESWVKTSGSKGYHIAFGLDGKADYGAVARFGHAVGRELVRRDPDNFTQEFYKADRGGRILIDTGRNEFGATYAAPYAVRPRRGAPVSAPCTWDEVENGLVSPATLTLRDVRERLQRTGDLWADLNSDRVGIPDASIFEHP